MMSLAQVNHDIMYLINKTKKKNFTRDDYVEAAKYISELRCWLKVMEDEILRKDVNKL